MTNEPPIPLDLTPPKTVAAAAARGLALRAQFGRGGTEIGVRRAHQLAAREEVSPEDIMRISSYFARHEVDKQVRSRVWGDERNPSAGYIAWLLWGGDEGRRWVTDLKAKLKGWRA